jgi:hypothetical protein
MSAPVKEHSIAEVVKEDITPFFRPPCRDCDFCDGLRDTDCQEKDDALGALRLEDEETHDGFEHAENTPKMMGRRRDEWKKRSSNWICVGRIMAKSFFLRQISCSLDSVGYDYGAVDWGLRGQYSPPW